jgi:hypothetical protein
MPRSHFWALRFEGSAPELRLLSQQGRLGFEYARTLALNAAERRHAGLRGGLVPGLVTVAQLAQRDETSPIDVNKKIKQARIDLFGKDLCDSAIYRRLRLRDDLRSRRCAEPRCDSPISLQASTARRYCDPHRTGSARARRLRLNRAQAHAGSS